METIERLKILIETKCGLRGVKAFADKIGIGQVTLNNYILRKRELGLKTVEAVLNAFPDVSGEWLLRGEGEMYRSDGGAAVAESKENVPMKPRIPYDATAGTLTDTVDGVTEYECEQLPVISAFPRYDFTIRITGRSMEPQYYAGDEVACLRVNEARFLQWGRVYVLDTEQGVVIKRIYDNGDCIRCSSFNPEYPDFDVPKTGIRSYNLVVGMLRL